MMHYRLLLCATTFWSCVTMSISDFIKQQEEPDATEQNNTLNALNNSEIDTAPQKSNAKTIAFNYQSEDLINIINFIAGKRDVNIVLPLKPEEQINQKVTWHLDRKVTLDEAWNILLTILDLAGYSVSPQKDYYEIVKSSEEIGRQPMPLYVGTPIDQLPQTEQQIRYIYYLSNIKLEDAESGTPSELEPVLKTLLPADSSFKLNAQSNSILFMAPAVDVRSVMSIVTQLDRPGFKEDILSLELLYADARTVANLFKDKILQNNDASKYRVDAKKASEATYFSKYVRLIAYDRKNTIIAIGRPQALQRVKEFITKYIDVKPDAGDSVLHTYQLQYLDAAPFADVLRAVVQSKKTDSQGPDQSTGEKKAAQGPERFFEDVLIAIDRAKGDDDQQGAATNQTVPDQTTDAFPAPRYYGSNTLIIAARGDDWKRIKQFIEAVDTPRPQVLIEVLVADITASDARALSNAFRNPLGLPMPGQTNVQSAQIDPGVMASSFANPPPTNDTIGARPAPSADLAETFNLSNGVREDPPAGTTGSFNIFGQPSVGTPGTGTFLPGSAALTVSDPDGSTWDIAKITKSLTNTRILSHPHFISTDNQSAYIEDTATRLIAGPVKVGEGGAAIQDNVNVSAALKVSIRPRISIAPQGSGRKHTVTLQVRIDINDFTASAASGNNTRTTRNVTTNAIINSGDVLALGGLLQNSENDSVSEVPALSRIPFIGSFFRGKDRLDGRTNLTVFISATVIEPKTRGEVSQYTRDYVRITKKISESGTFTSLKDPITRWFFNETKDTLTDKITDAFMSKDESHKNAEHPPMPVAHAEKPVANEFEQSKKQNARKIKDMMNDVQENPFKNINDSSKVHLRF